MADTASDFPVVVVGGGFYGCCLALYLRSVFDRVLLIEARDALLTRASRVNQARVHSGFHYPRSFVTALRSRELSARFAADFNDAVQSDFRMLYAIARRRSKVSGERFYRMFVDMKAPIAPASVADAALFNPDLVESVFDCIEFAFDWKTLRNHLERRLDAHGVTVWRGEHAERVIVDGDRNRLDLSSGRGVTTQHLFNVTYGGLNRLLIASGIVPLPLKYELAEVALVVPPPEIANRGVTVMDGQFYSMMPFPSEGLHSLTHVRYTPHLSWIDRPNLPAAYAFAASADRATRWRHMMMDAARFMPCATSMDYRKSLFDVKTVLTRNERDDGRPILLHRHRSAPSFFSIMGGKIDNIYDLFDVLPTMHPAFAAASDRLVLQAV